MRNTFLANRLRRRSGALPLVLMLAACTTPSGPPAPAAAATVGQAAVSAGPASQEPALANMLPATTTSKMGVPVELRYSFEGSVQAGQPVTLHLAAIPQVAGSNLAVSIKADPGIRTTAIDMHVEKATAALAYRQQLSVTRLAGGPNQLRVLVTMDLPVGSAFAYFGVPLEPVPAAGKKEPGRIE